MVVKLRRIPIEQKEALRRLLDDDLREFAELEGAPVLPDPDGHLPYEWFDAYWTDDRRLPFWISADGVIAGFCLLRHTGDGCEIAEFYVLPRFRRQRVGAEAVNALAAVCRKCATHLIAKVRKWNHPAFAFWRAQGFRVAGQDANDLITSLDLR
jgi:predicted acetyltransferase